jgi:beta-glucosidase
MANDEEKLRAKLSRMSLEEKVSLLSGKDFWTTKGIARLGIESLAMTDGPHGLRKQASEGGGVDLGSSVPATCFPSGAGLASTWDPDLAEEVGAALGEEARAEGVAVLLGPAVNIKRSPLCGRNFEYLSEDPYLAGRLAASFVRGVQSKGVGTSVKHFAANNQEARRMTIDARVDERSLREIYFPAFEAAVREGGAWTLMCAYNRLNGEYCSQNRRLLTGILREEWGFDGLLVTDWGACDDRVAGLAAGQDLEMPGNGGLGDAKVLEALREGRIDEACLDTAVLRFLRLHERASPAALARAACDLGAHHELARRAAAESAVLLKNEGAILPLRPEGRIAFIGAFAKEPRYQGGGSSHISPTRLDAAYDCAARLLEGRARLSYALGYGAGDVAPDAALIEEARRLAAAADVAIVFAGLPEAMESEGFDRPHLRMPEAQLRLIEALAEVQPRIAVVLQNGSPIEMPWLPRVPAVLETYLSGQGGGAAAVDLIFGLANPSGKLAETFPASLSDDPSRLNFPGDASKVEYREGIFVGYRHYDSAGVEPLFPFGHGLSYSRFEYSDLRVDKAEAWDDERVEVSVAVRNAGKTAGREVVQLYVRDLESRVLRPDRELKGFAKLALEGGEEKRARFSLDRRAFAYWEAEAREPSGGGAWTVEEGEFEILVGSSSRDIRASARLRVRPRSPLPRRYDRNTPLRELFEHPIVGAYARRLSGGFLAIMAPDPSAPGYSMFEAMSREIPLRSLVQMRSGMDEKGLEALLGVLRGEVDPKDAAFLRPSPPA